MVTNEIRGESSIQRQSDSSRYPTGFPPSVHRSRCPTQLGRTFGGVDTRADQHVAAAQRIETLNQLRHLVFTGLRRSGPASHLSEWAPAAQRSGRP